MAVPNPERELTRLRQALEDGLPTCMLIQGASEFFRREAIDLCLAAVPGDADLQSLDGEQDSDGRELEDLRGARLFGSGTVLAIRRGDKWLKTHGEALQNTLPAIAAGTSLILEVKKLDRRTKLAKALLAVGERFEFRDLYTEPYDRSRSPLEAEIVAWLVQRSRRAGCALQPDAAFVLMTSVGVKPGELLDELARIQTQVPSGKRALGAEDLRGILTCSFGSTPFEFAEAVLDFDRRRATRSLTAMYSRGTTGRDGTKVEEGGLFPFITSWLYQALAQLHEGRLLLDSGVPLADVPVKMGVRVFVDRLQGQLRRNRQERLRRGLLLLHRCQRELRTSGENPRDLLMQFLARYFAEEAA